MKRNRFLARSYGDNVEGAKAGLIKVLELLELHQEAVIVVPNIGKAKWSFLDLVIGADVAKTIIKNRSIVFSNGKKLSICGQSTLKNFKYSDIYLALWGSKFMIEEIEALPKWSELVHVTWIPDDATGWDGVSGITTIYDDGKRESSDK